MDLDWNSYDELTKSLVVANGGSMRGKGASTVLSKKTSDGS